MLPVIPKEINKSLIQSTVEHLVSAVAEGELTAAEVFIFCDALDKVSKTVKETVRKEVSDKDYALGLTISVSERSGGPDFEKDEEWQRLKKAIKEREDLLRSAFKLNKAFTDPDTGEIIPVLPEKPSSNTITVKY